ncbi:MAG TPA: hypothetical protein VGA69_04385 [Nitriliruptorales bacterium]
MRTLILRLFTPDDGSQVELHGVVEPPGGPATPFRGDLQLLAEVHRLVRDQRTDARTSRAQDVTLSPPEATAGR